LEFSKKIGVFKYVIGREAGHGLSEDKLVSVLNQVPRHYTD